MLPNKPLATAEEIGELAPIQRIVKETPYSKGFLRQLARAGKITAYKLNRDWLTTPAAVLAYVRTQQASHERKLEELAEARSLQ